MAQDNESKLQGEISSPVETSCEAETLEAALLAPTPSEDHSAASTTTTTSYKEMKRHYQALDSFSWSEEPNFVKIYIDFENADHLTDEQITFVS